MAMATASSSAPLPSSSSPSSPSLVDTLFQRSLDDLIKSLRSQPSSAEPAIVSRSLDEIRREIRSPDLDTKSVALQKLTYLSSLHFLDMSWAAFHAIELLPSPPSLPSQSRLAYLAAALSFHPSATELLPLATHQIHKHLTSNYAGSSSSALAAPALHLLALAASPDLARHLSTNLIPILNSSAAAAYSYLRPKAVAAALRVLSVYPEALPLLFKPLVDCLNSSDPRTVSAAVSAFCDLLISANDPAPYLPLAPEFYRILIDSRNNWALIKVLKIFARLAPLEPRLAARIVDPICEFMRRSSAKSLVFECVRTVLSSLSAHEQAVRLAVDKVKEFLAADDDPNLRYLGLQALSMLGPGQLWAVEENREVAIQSLTDPDPNIKREAMQLLMGIVSENNVVEISEMLIKYALKSDPEFANEILDAVLLTCGRNVYELILDFDWYVSLLGEMVRNPHCAKGEEIERQLVDIGLRVRDARPELVRVSRDILIDPALLGNPFLCRVLSAAAWISGEYVKFSRNPLELVEALLQPRISLLPSLVRAIYIQSVFKVLTFCLISYFEHMEAGHSPFIDNSTNAREEEDASIVSAVNSSSDTGIQNEITVVTTDKAISSSVSMEKSETSSHESIVYMLNLIETAISPLSESDEVEVQERSRNVLGLIHTLRQTGLWNNENLGIVKNEKTTEIVNLLKEAFFYELGPVSVNAQKRVSMPEGLVLNEHLADLAIVLGDDDATASSPSISFSLRLHPQELKEEPTAESTSQLVEHRKRHGLYYLPTEKGSEWNDYPHANDPLSPVSHGDAPEDLIKLSEQSLIPRRAKPTKPRPVVVKLDEGEVASSSGLTRVYEPKDDILSGAIRDVLLGNEGKKSSIPKKSSDRSSQRRKKDKSDKSESISMSKERENLGEREHGSSSSRSGHQRHHKERNGSPGKNEDEEIHMKSKRSGHHHGRHKHRQRGDSSISIVPHAPVIQDFLL